MDHLVEITSSEWQELDIDFTLEGLTFINRGNEDILVTFGMELPTTLDTKGLPLPPRKAILYTVGMGLKVYVRALNYKATSHVNFVAIEQTGAYQNYNALLDNSIYEYIVGDVTNPTDYLDDRYPYNAPNDGEFIQMPYGMGLYG